MSKIENTLSTGHAMRTLRNDELDVVNGGYVLIENWSIRDFVSITPLPAGSDRMLNFS
jgi:hypothetical protein